MLNPTYILVLAGSAAEVAMFAQSTQVPLGAFRYVNTEESVRGMADPAYIVLPGFWSRIDAASIWAAIQLTARKGMRLDLPFGYIGQGNGSIKFTTRVELRPGEKVISAAEVAEYEHLLEAAKRANDAELATLNKKVQPPSVLKDALEKALPEHQESKKMPKRIPGAGHLKRVPKHIRASEDEE